MNKEGMGGCIVPSGNCRENSSCMLISLSVTDLKAGLPSPERWMVWVKWVTLGECFPLAIVWYELFIAVAYYQLYKQNLQVLCEWWQVLVNKNALKTNATSVASDASSMRQDFGWSKLHICGECSCNYIQCFVSYTVRRLTVLKFKSWWDSCSQFALMILVKASPVFWLWVLQSGFVQLGTLTGFFEIIVTVHWCKVLNFKWLRGRKLISLQMVMVDTLTLHILFVKAHRRWMTA